MCPGTILVLCAPARPVAARHGHRTAGHRGGARPRLVLRLRLGRWGLRHVAIGVAARRADGIGHLTERLEAVAAHERVDPRQSRHQAARPRFEAGRADAWVDPHDAIGQPAQTPHLAPDQRRVAPLPSVGQDHNHRAARHPALAVAVVERLQRVADPRAARPVGRGGRSALDRSLGVTRSQRARDASQASGEDKGFGVRPSARGAGEELNIGACVWLHRARDVAQQDDPPTHHPPPAPGQPDRVAGRAQAASQCAAQVDSLAVAAPLGAPRAALRGGEPDAGHQAVQARRARPARARRSAWRAAPPRLTRGPARGHRAWAPRPIAGTRWPRPPERPQRPWRCAVARLPASFRLARPDGSARRRARPAARAPRRTRSRTPHRRPAPGPARSRTRRGRSSRAFGGRRARPRSAPGRTRPRVRRSPARRPCAVAG